MTENARIAELEDEVAHWKRIALDPQILWNDDGRGPVMRHAAVAALANAFGAMIGDAPNYVAMEVSHPVHGMLIVTVQRATGKAPYALASEYRARLEAMGVSDLEPLPEQHPMHQPDPAIDHVWVNSVARRFECRACGADTPVELPMSGQRFAELMGAFADLHRKCGGDR